MPSRSEIGRGADGGTDGGAFEVLPGAALLEGALRGATLREEALAGGALIEGALAGTARVGGAGGAFFGAPGDGSAGVAAIEQATFTARGARIAGLSGGRDPWARAWLP